MIINESVIDWETIQDRLEAEFEHSFSITIDNILFDTEKKEIKVIWRRNN